MNPTKYVLCLILAILPFLQAEQCSQRSKALQECLQHVKSSPAYTALKSKKIALLGQCAAKNPSLKATCVDKIQKANECKEKLSRDGTLKSARDQMLAHADACFQKPCDPFFVLSSSGGRNKPAAGNRVKRQNNQKANNPCAPIFKCLRDAETDATQSSPTFMQQAKTVHHDQVECRKRNPVTYDCVASSRDRQQCIKDASSAFDAQRKSAMQTCMGGQG